MASIRLVAACALFVSRPGLSCSLPEGPVRAVVSVLDSETLLLDDQTKLRLVGALAPAPPSANVAVADWQPAAAAKAALEKLAEGQSVLLTFDDTRSDRYGRQLAQAYLVSETGSSWLQGRMVQDGMARAYALPGNAACLAELVSLEAKARVTQLGLWRNSAYAIRHAGEPKELMRYAGSFQLVEGVVTSVGGGRGRTYLDFGQDWHEDFSIAIAPAVRKELSGRGIDLGALTGKRIRARGWIEISNGPLITIGAPDDIELMP
jgi:endonuclease YncB( thermonuclease family)